MPVASAFGGIVDYAIDVKAGGYYAFSNTIEQTTPEVNVSILNASNYEYSMEYVGLNILYNYDADSDSSGGLFTPCFGKYTVTDYGFKRWRVGLEIYRKDDGSQGFYLPKFSVTYGITVWENAHIMFEIGSDFGMAYIKIGAGIGLTGLRNIK